MLTLWRARLRASERPERIFDAVRRVVAESGVLATRDRRALDSTILHDAVATQDTVTMISSQIRRCRRLIPEAADLVLAAHDYESVTKPSCDWSDPDARSELVDGLVTDGLRLIEAVEGVKLDPDQADALGLLGVVDGPGCGTGPPPGRPMADSSACGEGSDHIDGGIPKRGMVTRPGPVNGTGTRPMSLPNP